MNRRQVVNANSAESPPGENLKSPLTGRACVWWDYRVDSKEQNEKGETVFRTIEQATNRIVAVAQEEQGRLFGGIKA